jgi:hypothetical protein
MQKKSYWFGGAIMSAFSGIILMCLHLQGGNQPAWVMVMLWICLLWGLWAIALDLFGINRNGPMSCVMGALMVASTAVWAFVVAWTQKEGWSGTAIPFVPAAWNQAAPRILFALGGLLGLLFSFKLLRKAFNKFRGARDKDTSLSIE